VSFQNRNINILKNKYKNKSAWFPFSIIAQKLKPFDSDAIKVCMLHKSKIFAFSKISAFILFLKKKCKMNSEVLFEWLTIMGEEIFRDKSALYLL